MRSWSAIWIIQIFMRYAEYRTLDFVVNHRLVPVHGKKTKTCKVWIGGMYWLLQLWRNKLCSSQPVWLHVGLSIKTGPKLCSLACSQYTSRLTFLYVAPSIQERSGTWGSTHMTVYCKHLYALTVGKTAQLTSYIWAQDNVSDSVQVVSTSKITYSEQSGS